VPPLNLLKKEKKVMTKENRQIKWGEAICMIICVSLLIVVFRFSGFGRLLGTALGGVCGAFLGIGIYYLFTYLKRKVISA
jgi:hypothetical protein